MGIVSVCGGFGATSGSLSFFRSAGCGVARAMGTTSSTVFAVSRFAIAIPWLPFVRTGVAVGGVAFGVGGTEPLGVRVRTPAVIGGIVGTTNFWLALGGAAGAPTAPSVGMSPITTHSASALTA